MQPRLLLRSKMRIVLTGGIACGKSTFAKFLGELGIRFLDADDVVHELEGPGGAAVPAILACWGQSPALRGHSLLLSSGGIDRRRLAEIVFHHPEERKRLEEILFPLVRERLLRFVDGDDGTTEPGIRLAIIPLLFESHWESDYDIILCIASPRELQIERMERTRGYTREQASARLAAQWPVAEKVARADFTVQNDSTPEHLRDEAVRLVSWLEKRVHDEHGRREGRDGGRGTHAG